MTAPGSVLDAVRGLITRLAPRPICDDCVAQALALPMRQYANQKARQLAGSDGFERRRDLCAMCSGEKLVTRLTGR